MTPEELDQWAAEKVMGWKSGLDYFKNPSWWGDDNGRKYIEFPVDTWHPSTDANQAFMVVERMRDLGWRFVLWVDHDGECAARFAKDKNPGIDKSEIVLNAIGTDIKLTILTAAHAALGEDK